MVPARQHLQGVTALFGETVRAWRKKLGLSQEDLAFSAGLHRTYIADIERGARNPSLETIAKLVMALDITFVELFSALQGLQEPMIQPPKKRKLPK